MRRLKEVYPEFESEVAFYAIGTDPTESIDELEAYRNDQGYPWPVATAGKGMLADFRVLQQSTKIAFDAQGILTYRDGYGRGDPDIWREVFRSLASGG